MAILLHELWEEMNGEETFCLAGPRGDAARKLMGAQARLVWSVRAGSHFEAMTKYWAFRGWGTYTTPHDQDRTDYPEEWAAEQSVRAN